MGCWRLSEIKEKKIKTNSVYDVSTEITKELFPIPVDSPLWEYIQWYNNKYDKFIIFKIEVKT